MKKKVFIITTHKYTPSRRNKEQWEATEKCEFVDQLRPRHYSEATVIVDYINEVVIKGKNKISYKDFENYVRESYPQQMKELDSEYKPSPVVLTAPEVIDASEVIDVKDVDQTTEA